MTDQLIEVGEGFWNIRGSFRVAGILDVGTQCSLARLESGDFVLLDAYRLSPAIAARVRALTDRGRALRAVLHLHPFHTVHCRSVAQQFPRASLYGTRRHKAVAPELPWQPLHTEDEALQAQFADDFAFTVPRGVDFIPDNSSLHFASVLAKHRRSKALHVDDTLTWTSLPLAGGLRFHPTLRFVLQQRPGAVADFRKWTRHLRELSEDVDHLCTAHGRSLPPPSTAECTVSDRIRQAVRRAQRLLNAHEKRYG